MVISGGDNINVNINQDECNAVVPHTASTTSWTATTLTNAPSARKWHTAVWSGSQMIVWGGFYYDSFTATGFWYNTGGRYNPSTNSWTATSTTNAPEARFFPTAVWTGTEMIVWGGASIIGVLNSGR